MKSCVRRLLSLSLHQALLAAGLDPDRILATSARVFFNQVFRDGFFHGDMHPGNMLVAEDGAVVAMDFGIMGRLDLATRRNLALILLGFLTRDYVQVADVFFRIGMVPRDQDRATFTQAHQYPLGIEYVLVNGQTAVANERTTSVRAGVVLPPPR